MSEVNRKIRDRGQYDRGIWDWGILEGCFGDTRITPTDIDGCIERKGKFLYIETKRPGAEVPKGQMIVLQQLARQGATVLIVHGDQDKAERITKLTAYGEQPYSEADNETFRKIVADWYEWADGQRDAMPAHKLARLLMDRLGPDYCDVLMSEIVRLSI